MKPEQYLFSNLNDLKTSFQPRKISNNVDLTEEIFRLVMSKKFRKCSVSPEYAEHIRQSIEQNIKNNNPIKIAFVFGSYKLWQLKESPEVDWAELFSLIYYANWLKPICEIYRLGVWYDFYSDDVIVPKMDNIDPADTLAYRESFKKLLGFIKKYLPNNLKITYNRVGDQYKNEAEFNADLREKMETLKDGVKNGLPELSDEMRALIDLNVKPTEEQLKDPHWREKIALMHDAYCLVKYRRPYYRVPDKILASTYRVKNSISVGTTKRSIAKFWVGVGVLEKNGDDFNQLILSPTQIANSNLKEEPISMPGLIGKNFRHIKIKG